MFKRKLKRDKVYMGLLTFADTPNPFDVEVEGTTSLVKSGGRAGFPLCSALSEKWGLTANKEKDLILTDFSEAKAVFSEKYLDFYELHYIGYKLYQAIRENEEVDFKDSFKFWINQPCLLKPNLQFNLMFSSLINGLFVLCSLPFMDFFAKLFSFAYQVYPFLAFSIDLQFICLFYSLFILFLQLSLITFSFLSGCFTVSDFVSAKYLKRSKHNLSPNNFSFLTIYKSFSSLRLFWDPLKAVPKFLDMEEN